MDRVIRSFPELRLEKRADEFIRFFEKYLPASSRVLDVGGAWGFYNRPLKSRGHHLTVLDVVKPGFQKAPLVLYRPEEAFPFADKSFDAVLLITMLHHVPDPEAILREAGRVSRGIVVVVEDLYRHPLGRIWTIFRDMLYNFEFFGHPMRFKKRSEWSEIFKRMGFGKLFETEIYTWLAGLRILNGIFILKPPTR